MNVTKTWFGKAVLSTTIALSLFVVGCSQDDGEAVSAPLSSQASNSSSSPSSWDPSLAEPARLISTLPATTLAYVRIPTLWGLLAAPKSGALRSAMDSEANRDAIMALQQGIPALMEAEFGEFGPLLSLLLAQLRSPLEIALVGAGSQPLEADLVIEARLAMDSVDELNALLAQYTDPSSPFQLLQAASADQPGQLLLGIAPMFYQFDAQSQRVRMIGGAAAQAESLAASRDWSNDEPTTLLETSQALDGSGHGLLIWTDGERLIPTLEPMANDNDLAQLRDLGLLGLHELAIAYGSTEGQARFSILARGEDGPIWDYGLPALAASDVALGGRADFVAGLVIPDQDWIERLWRTLSDSADEKMAEANTRMMEATGVSFSTWTGALAGRWMLMGDASGSYLVHDATRPEAWTDLFDGLSERFDIQQSEHQGNGQTIHHLVIPGMDVSETLPAADTIEDQAARFVLQGLSELGTHIYWAQDGDSRRVLAGVPQVLRDRRALASEVNVGEWLNDAGIDQHSATAFAAIEVAKAPQRNYYAYLGVLQALSDFFDTEVNLNAFPSAHELNLADSGTVGAELSYTEGRIGLSLIFENHPGDVIYSGAGGLMGLAVVGTLAAIAIPAYQDYTQRAMSSAFLMSAAGAKLAIAEFYISEGRLPNAEEAPGFSQVFDGGPISRIDYNARLLRLVLQLTPEAGFGDNAALELVPVLQDGMVSRWRCSSPTIDAESLPSECQP